VNGPSAAGRYPSFHALKQPSDAAFVLSAHTVQLLQLTRSASELHIVRQEAFRFLSKHGALQLRLKSNIIQYRMKKIN